MQDLLSQLKKNNIFISLHKNDIKVKFNGDKLPNHFIEKIKNNKQAIIDYLTHLNNQLETDSIIPVLAEQESYSVSSSQRRLWVLSQFAEGNVAYNMPGVYLFEGKLDTSLLENAFIHLIARHEILRTYFKENSSGELRQWLLAPDEHKFSLAYRDLRLEHEGGKQVRSLVQQEFNRPFDLAEGPLLRAGIYQLEDHKWIFTYTMHHIISDGWSMGILIKELLQYYNAFLKGTDFLQAPLRIQYKDYAAWQQEQLSADSLQGHRAYWLKQFEGDLPVLALAGDRIRPAIKSFNGSDVYFRLDKEPVKEFKSLISNQGGTLFMGILALVKVLLYRYTGQQDIVTGSPIAGREHADLQNQIGFYLNTLPLRTHLNKNDGFNALLENIKEVTMGAYEHQIYPFDELIDELGLKRDMSRNPLFDVMVILQNAGTSLPADLGLDGLKISNFESGGSELSKFDLTFNFTERGEYINVHIEYNTDIYNQTSIERMAAHLNQLLKAIVASPGQPIGKLDYLTVTEKERLITEFNNTSAPYAADKTIISLFEDQVLKSPDRIAVVFEDRELSYRELNEQANRLAAYIKDRYAVQADDRVGILLERSADMLITMLGILKSGAAYVPIDPEYPADRISYITEDSSCKVVISKKELETFFPESEKYQPDNLNLSGNVSDLAYVIYTSGSTGKPKGVMIAHANVVSFFSGMNHILGTEPGVMLALTNYTFDISVLELLWTLTLGYQVIIHSDVKNINTYADREVKPLDFGLFYFGNSASLDKKDEYELLIEGAKYADINGYKAIWTPERHFHEFGGLYPNPAVLGAALSTITRNIDIRAGSVVVPLHDPILIAEAWSVIDNLSDGRAGIACASGWQSNDFVLAPENYSKRHEVMYNNIETIQKLWRGESVMLKDGNGFLKDTRIYPEPIQKELPLWITSAGSIETFITAGKLGLNILTHLLGETVEGISTKIAAYRKAYEESGHEKGKSKVVLMLHTYIGENLEETHEKAKAPFINYIRSSLSLVKNLAVSMGYDVSSEEFKEENIDAMLDYSFNRYVSSSSLIGTKASCLEVLEKVAEIGVDEIACLIDFGINTEAVMKSLKLLTQLKDSYHHSDYSLYGQIKKYKVTHIQCTPSTAALLNNHSTDWDSMQSIRTWLIGGERISPSLISDFQKNLPSLNLYNVYGPTETTIWSTSLQLKRGESISIGRPLQHEQIFILDSDHHSLQPIGVAGELCISGAGLARGYLNMPELTAEKFVSNPFIAGERMYKTGDLARWLPNGNIEFIGRKDDQVKVRGYRIELGEIENAVQHHPGVDSAAVIIRAGLTGENELFCYVVGQQELTSADLRGYLGKSLPSYMIPGHYIQLESMPLTTNGKISRKDLPEPEGTGMNSGVVYIAPRNETEAKLVTIWEEILGRDKIGVNDSFFEIGGHSLRATSLASQIHKVFNVRLGLRELFNITVLADQARLIAETAKTSFVTIGSLARQESYELSSSQRRLWVLSQFPEGNIAYNMPGIYVFEGNLDVSRLKKAFASLISRHEVLRTVFREDHNTNVRQFVLSNEEHGFVLEYQDHRTDENRVQKIRHLVEQEFALAFDLAGGPLVRAGVHQLEDHKWIFTYTMHHIISDGWSMGILIRELLQYYNGLISGEKFSPAPLRIHYKDYAAWQQEQLKEDTLAGHRAYWLEQFEGEIPVLDLYGENMRPAIKTYHAASTSFRLDSGLTKGLKSLVSGQGSTLFMGLLAVVKVLFYRYTGQEDIIIGSPIAGRGHADLEEQIGYYVNTLALRTRFNGSNDFYALLENIKGVTLAAYEHQIYPFDELVDELNLRRDMSRNPLFDVMVVLQNAGSDHFNDLGFTDLEVKHYTEIDNYSGKFDITFDFTELGEEIYAGIEYNTDIYDKVSIEHLITHFERLVKVITDQPDQSIAQLDYLSNIEKHQLLQEFNRTAVYYPAGEMLAVRFEQQVLSSPDHTAIIYNGNELSYRELNERSNRLAAYLREQHSIQPGERIGIMLGRSAEMVITILGVLKSGGAYVPVDPEYPKDRISYMIADSGCRVLVDQLEFKNFVLGEGKYTSDNIDHTGKTSDPAYIIYTSGSTGKPKGVMISQQSLIDYVNTFTLLAEVSARDRVIFQSSISFDTHVEEIFPVLLKGGSLVIAANGGRDIDELHTLIKATDATLLSATPLVLNELNHRGFLTSLRLIVSGGDRFNNAYLSNYIGHTKVYNSYGPTESTVCSTFHEIDNQGTAALIGRPIANRSIFILNDYEGLQPVGIAGELCIGGTGLSMGYLNQPELTAEKFVANPFIPGERMYKTGDTARWLPDGSIEFIGRKDDQVKIRGYRIEPGEIENIIQHRPDIESVAVVSRVNQNHEQELVCYLVSKQDVNPSEIRTYLSGFVPAYMIPAHYVQLEQLPLTPNGKIDNRYLLQLDNAADLDQAAVYIGPRNETEERLLNIWQKVLGLEDISIHANFFNLGGNSFKIVEMQRAVNLQFKVNFGVTKFFELLTIEDLAVVLNQELLINETGDTDGQKVIDFINF